jgi:hypothetical protein
MKKVLGITLWVILVISIFVCVYITLGTIVSGAEKSIDEKEFKNVNNFLPSKEVGKSFFPEKEYNIIKKAADRNNCFDDNFLVLLSIRKSENGRPGREFGIMNKAANNLDKQAGWAACTIVKNRDRWNKTDKKIDFITFLGSKYCPVGASNDPTGLNKNWVKNVKTWYNKIKG